MVKRYKAFFEPNIPVNAIAPHVSMGFNNMWILLNDVLPRAIQKHGGFNAEALAKAARETDIPEGGTMQGYGVKFLPRGPPMRGPERARHRRGVPGHRGQVPPRLAQGRRHARSPSCLPTSSPFAAR